MDFERKKLVAQTLVVFMTAVTAAIVADNNIFLNSQLSLDEAKDRKRKLYDMEREEVMLSVGSSGSSATSTSRVACTGAIVHPMGRRRGKRNKQTDANATDSER
jgi:hypothetical protein